jgi:glucose-1-phosphate thymidylyltransferase
VTRFREVNEGAMILLKRVPDPGRYGVAELSADKKKVVAIEEKPKQPKSDYAVTGMYFYDAAVFSIVKTLKPSGRGELEITDVNNDYIRRQQLLWDELPGEWTDAGTFPSLLKANEIMAE